MGEKPKAAVRMLYPGVVVRGGQVIEYRPPQHPVRRMGRYPWISPEVSSSSVDKSVDGVFFLPKNQLKKPL